MRWANYELIGRSSEPEMSDLTHDDDTVRAYSQNILQEVLLLTKHSNNLPMIVRGYHEGVENSRYHPILEIHSSTHVRIRFDCAALFGDEVRVLIQRRGKRGRREE